MILHIPNTTWPRLYLHDFNRCATIIQTSTSTVLFVSSNRLLRKNRSRAIKHSYTRRRIERRDWAMRSLSPCVSTIWLASFSPIRLVINQSSVLELRGMLVVKVLLFGAQSPGVFESTPSNATVYSRMHTIVKLRSTLSAKSCLRHCVGSCLMHKAIWSWWSSKDDSMICILTALLWIYLEYQLLFYQHDTMHIRSSTLLAKFRHSMFQTYRTLRIYVAMLQARLA